MASTPRTLLSAGPLVLAVIAALLLLAGPSLASGPPQSGSGTGQLLAPPTIDSERTAGSNSIQERTLMMSVSGTLTGTFVQNVRGVVHDGAFVTFQGTGTFTGTMDCGGGDIREGTLTLGIAGKGSAGENPVTESSVRVISQVANTIQATGTGTVFQNGPLMSYEIQFVCH